MEGVSRRLGRHSFVPLIINLPRRPGRIQRTLYIPGTIIKRLVALLHLAFPANRWNRRIIVFRLTKRTVKCVWFEEINGTKVI